MKPLKHKIPVEPLSEPRWQRVDDAVFAALDTESVGTDKRAPSVRPLAPKARGRVLYIVGALAVAAVVLAFVLRGVLSGVLGDKPELALNPSHIETGAEPSRLAIGESSLQIAPSSAVVASGDADNGVLVVLEKGSIDCEVAPRKGRPPFVVQAGDVRVRVVGTRFAVQRSGSAVRVTVSHGAVEVSGASQTVMLHDGESWPNATTPTPSTTASNDAPADSASAAPDSMLPAVSNAVPGATASPSASFNPAKNDQRAYQNAASLESSDPDAAMATYKRLASGGGPWASNALFAEGQLAASRGRNADAKKFLQSYLTRYPHGNNAEDARRILGRLD
jgi:hypothetical protein